MLNFILVYKKHLSFAGALSQRTQNLTIIKSNKFNLHLETDDYQINYVNINLGHQYGIPVGEAQKLNVPRDKKQGDTVVFAGYYLKASDRIAS